MKVDDSVYLVVSYWICYWLCIVFCDELDSDVCDEFGEVVGLYVRCKVLYIKMLNMNSLWILMMMCIEILAEVLVLKLAG